MTAYKDEKRGTWFANFRYKDWRGESKQKSKRGFRTKREAQAWERDFKKKMSRAASMEFSLACDIYLKDNAPRVRETTLEQKRYYIEQILKPYFEGMLVGDIDAKAVIDWENHLLEESHETRHTLHSHLPEHPLQPTLCDHEPLGALLRPREKSRADCRKGRLQGEARDECLDARTVPSILGCRSR